MGTDQQREIKLGYSLTMPDAAAVYSGSSKDTFT
jgi:hypothetical protein